MNYDFDEAPQNEHGGAREPEWVKNARFYQREHHMGGGKSILPAAGMVKVFHLPVHYPNSLLMENGRL